MYNLLKLTTIEASNLVKLSIRDSYNIGSACHKLGDMYQQLFESTGLSFFCYARFDKDRKLTMLSSNDIFQQTYIEDQLSHKIYQHYDFDTLHMGKFFCDDIASQQSEQEALQLVTQVCGISNLVVINEPHEGYTETFNFGAPVREVGARSVYLNNQQFLQDYLAVTKKQIKGLVDQHSIPSIYVPPAASLKQTPKRRPKVNESEILLRHSQQYDNYISLTRRETTCLTLLMDGLSSKQIADVLSLSKRTIENNINRIMDKFNVSSRIQLLSQMHSKYRFYSSHQMVVPLA